MVLARLTFGTIVLGRRRRLLLGVLGLAFAVLTGLDIGGKLSEIDQYAVDHLMPDLHPGQVQTHESRGLYLPFGLNTNWWTRVLDLWLYPCSVLISALVIAGVAGVLWRREARPVAAAAWIAAWVAGNGIEVIGKYLIIRPDLVVSQDGVRFHVGSFDQSFPSGHMIRGLIIGGAVAYLWRRASSASVVWLLLVGPFLVVTSAHTPSDVLGGALVGLFIVVLVTAVDAGGPDRRPQAAPAQWTP